MKMTQCYSAAHISALEKIATAIMHGGLDVDELFLLIAEGRAENLELDASTLQGFPLSHIVTHVDGLTVLPSLMWGTNATPVPSNFSPLYNGDWAMCKSGVFSKYTKISQFNENGTDTMHSTIQRVLYEKTSITTTEGHGIGVGGETEWNDRGYYIAGGSEPQYAVGHLKTHIMVRSYPGGTQSHNKPAFNIINIDGYISGGFQHVESLSGGDAGFIVTFQDNVLFFTGISELGHVFDIISETTLYGSSE
jgi:hypothetical protein